MFNNCLTTILLQITSPAAESVPDAKQEISQIGNLSFDTLVNNLVDKLVSFALALAAAAIVFYLGKFIINKIFKFVSSILRHRNVEASLSTFVLSLTKMLLYFILIVTVVGILGIETSSFIAIFASAGVALGMAMSGTLQNFAGGVLILLLKPYKVGDFIEAQGFAGTVKEIQIFNTVLTTGDNKSITIPNGGLSTGSINNYSREDFRRVDIDVSIAYGDNVENARHQILDIVSADSRVITESETAGRGPVVYVKALAASSVDLTVRVCVRSADYWGVYFSLNEQFYTLLPERGINFPYPQMDVHILNH